MRKRYIKCNYLTGGISIGLFCLLILGALFPSVKTESYAVDCAPGEEPCTTTMAETAIDLTVASTVSVALESEVELNVIPKSTGSFTETTSKLTVATNNPSGYAIYLQAGKSQNGKANLISSDLSNSAMINPVNGTVGSNNFSANTWGYSMDGTNYQAVPATTSIIKETTATSYNDTYTLSFGVKVDTNLPAGQYTNSVIVSAIANPIKVTSLNQLIYMQDMTADICSNTAEHVTKQLIDNRDGKKYWVAKLKDGNCWMTQNLDLELGLVNNYAAAVAMNGNKVMLSNQNTDISTANWNTSMGTTWMPTTTSKTVPDSSASVVDGAHSWDAGMVILTNPTQSEGCGVNLGVGENLSNLPTVCPSYFKTIVPGMADIYVATATSSFDNTTNTYDAHYLIGNYYSWGAATAGTGKQVTNDGDSAPGSICAKGWKMGSGDELADLFYDAYKFGDDKKDLAAFSSKPLYFVKGGKIYFSHSVGGVLSEMGGAGHYWSDTLESSMYAYVTRFDNEVFNSIRDAEAGIFYQGLSVRCLAR